MDLYMDQEPIKWAPVWTLSMDYPRGPPLIFEDEFVPEAGVNEF